MGDEKESLVGCLLTPPPGDGAYTRACALTRNRSPDSQADVQALSHAGRARSLF